MTIVPCCWWLLALVLLPANLETQEAQAPLWTALTLLLGGFCPMVTCQPVSAQSFPQPDSYPSQALVSALCLPSAASLLPHAQCCLKVFHKE